MHNKVGYNHESDYETIRCSLYNEVQVSNIDTRLYQNQNGNTLRLPSKNDMIKESSYLVAKIEVCVDCVNVDNIVALLNANFETTSSVQIEIYTYDITVDVAKVFVQKIASNIKAQCMVVQCYSSNKTDMESMINDICAVQKHNGNDNVKIIGYCHDGAAVFKKIDV